MTDQEKVDDLKSKIADYCDVYMYETDRTIARIFYERKERLKVRLYWLTIWIKVKSLFQFKSKK